MAKKKKSAFLTGKPYFSKSFFFVFLIIFAAIGGYIIWRALGLTPAVGVIEAESMKRPQGLRVIKDPAASGGKAVLMDRKIAAPRVISGSTSPGFAPYTVQVTARATRCKVPNSSVMTVYLKGGGAEQKLFTTKVGSKPWKVYRKTKLNIQPAPEYSVRIAFNSYNKTGKCYDKLYIDNVRLLAKPPTVLVQGVTVGTNSAKITGSINNNAIAGEYYVIYGTGIPYANLSAKQNLPGSIKPQAAKVNLSGLSANTTYNYQLCAVSQATAYCSPGSTFRTKKADGTGGSGGSSSNNNTPTNNPPAECGGGQVRDGNGNCVCPSGWTMSGGNCVLDYSNDTKTEITDYYCDPHAGLYKVTTNTATGSVKYDLIAPGPGAC